MTLLEMMSHYEAETLASSNKQGNLQYTYTAQCWHPHHVRDIHCHLRRINKSYSELPSPSFAPVTDGKVYHYNSQRWHPWLLDFYTIQ